MLRSWFLRPSSLLRPCRNRNTRRAARRQERTRLAVLLLEGRITPSNAPFQIDRPAAVRQFSAAAADAQDNSVIVYQGGSDIYFQMVDAHGDVTGDPVLVNTPSGGDHIEPTVAMAPDGRFVIAWWGDGPDGSGAANLWARRFNADGTAADPAEFAVGPYLDVTSGWAWTETVAIDPNGNFMIASTDDTGSVPTVYGRLFSWDLQTTSADIPLVAASLADQGCMAPRVSMSASGTFVASYLDYGPGPSFGGIQQAEVQQFAYASVGSGGFQVTPVGAPTALAGRKVLPVAAPDGSFVAVINTMGTGAGIAIEHFAADGSPLDAAAIPVAAAAGNASWPEAAGLDGSGNLWVAWQAVGSPSYSAGDLYVQQLAPDGTPQIDPVRITPQSTMASESSAAAAVAVAPDGSLTAGWTTYDAAANSYGVEARHYDPILSSTTETDTLTGGSTGQQVSVTSTATTFADHVLWEYRVTNINYTGSGTSHDAADVGLFSVLHGTTGSQDLSNSLGWVNDDSGLEGPGIGWLTAPDGSLLAPGQTAYYTFTTPTVAVGHVEAQAGESNHAGFADGKVLGPVTADSGVSISAVDATATAWDSGTGSGVTPGTYVVSRTGDVSNPLTFSYSVGGDAVAGVDYQPLSGSVTIPAGKQSATIVVTPLVTNTNAAHTVTVGVVPFSGISLLANILVENITDPPDGGGDIPVLPSVSVDALDPTAYEGKSTGDFRITRNGEGAALTVNVSLSGGLGQHFTATVNGGTFSGGPLVIPAGQSSVDVLITPVSDGDTANNVATLSVSSGSGYTFLTTAQASVAIIDDGLGDGTPQPLPVVTIQAIDPNATALTDPGMFRFSLDRLLPYYLTVHFSVSETGSAAFTLIDQDGDYALDYDRPDYYGGPQIVIAPETGHVDVLLMAALHPPLWDGSYGGDGSGTVTIAATSGDYVIGGSASATVSVAGNSGVGEPYVVAAPLGNIAPDSTYPYLHARSSPDPGDSLIGVELVSSGPIINPDGSRRAINIAYSGPATPNGTSSVPGSFMPLYYGYHSLPWFPGGVGIGTVLQDAGDNGPAAIQFKVQGGTGYTVGTWGTITIAIVDGDNDGPTPPSQNVTVEAIDPTASQPTLSSGLFRFTRFGDTSGSLTVPYQVGDLPNGNTDGGFTKDGVPDAQAGTDYFPVDDGSGIGSVTFAPGQTSVLVPVDPIHYYPAALAPDQGRLAVTVNLLPDATNSVYGLNPVTQAATVTIMFDPLLIHAQVPLEAQNHTVTGMAFTADEYDTTVNPFLSVHIIDQPTHGTLRRRFDGSYDYIGNTGYTGLDSFSYQLSDGPILSDIVHAQVLSYGDAGTLPPGAYSDFPLMAKALFVGNNGLPDPKSVKQGDTIPGVRQGIDDCWFVAAAAGLALQRPNGLALDLFGDSPDPAKYRVTLPGYQALDIPVAVNDGHTYSTANGDWLRVLEQAYAQSEWNKEWANNSIGAPDAYTYISRANLASAGIRALTGHDSKKYPFSVTFNDTIRTELDNVFLHLKVVCVGSGPKPGMLGVEPNHIYTVVDYDKRSDRVRLRNPWGHNDTYGPDNRFQGQLDNDNAGQNNGYFWIPLQYMTNYFKEILFEK